MKRMTKARRKQLRKLVIEQEPPDPRVRRIRSELLDANAFQHFDNHSNANFGDVHTQHSDYSDYSVKM